MKKLEKILIIFLAKEIKSSHGDWLKVSSCWSILLPGPREPVRLRKKLLTMLFFFLTFKNPKLIQNSVATNIDSKVMIGIVLCLEIHLFS